MKKQKEHSFKKYINPTNGYWYNTFCIHLVDVSQLNTKEMFKNIYFAQSRHHKEYKDLYDLKTISASLCLLFKENPVSIR